MAVLYNLDHTLSVGIYFFEDFNDKEWIKYEIIVESESHFGSPIVFNEETANTYLYLENFIEPEVPELVQKLDDLCRGTIEYMIFQPIDERDFKLEIHMTGDSAKVELLLELVPDPETYSFYTNKNELAKFAAQMEKEYGELISGKHALLVCE